MSKRGDSSFRVELALALALAVAGSSFSACFFIQESEDRANCDQALDKVCACATIDCATGPQHPTVQLLRECDSDEIYRDRGYHLAVCIQDSARYCEVLNGLVTSDQALCDVPCNGDNACDLEASCQAFQSTDCDQP